MTETIPTNQDILTGHYVYIDVYDEFYCIGNVEPFQYESGEETTAYFSAVAVNASSAFANILDLEPDDKPNRHLFQAMIGVKYGIKYYFKIPTGTARFGTDRTKGIGFLRDVISPFHSPNKDFQMWFVNDYYPAVGVSNTSSEVLTPKIQALGFKYELKPLRPEMVEKLKNKMVPYKYITIGGLKC